jgi:hypothetical protein
MACPTTCSCCSQSSGKGLSENRCNKFILKSEKRCNNILNSVNKPYGSKTTAIFLGLWQQADVQHFKASDLSISQSQKGASVITPLSTSRISPTAISEGQQQSTTQTRKNLIQTNYELATKQHLPHIVRQHVLLQNVPAPRSHAMPSSACVALPAS